MEIIKSVVREIAIIVLLASFLEMLLPKSNMKRFVQVILGLFILISILNPIASLISNDEMVFQIEAWKFQPQSSYQIDEIITQGQRISQVSENVTLREYEARIEKQINALIQLVSGVEYVEVLVKVAARDSGVLGEIKQVNVNIFDEPQEKNTSAKLDSVRIDEVVINIQEPKIDSEKDKIINHKNFSDDKRQAEVANLISNFYSLPLERIKVELQ